MTMEKIRIDRVDEVSGLVERVSVYVPKLQKTKGPFVKVSNSALCEVIAELSTKRGIVLANILYNTRRDGILPYSKAELVEHLVAHRVAEARTAENTISTLAKENFFRLYENQDGEQFFVINPQFVSCEFVNLSENNFLDTLNQIAKPRPKGFTALGEGNTIKTIGCNAQTGADTNWRKVFVSEFGTLLTKICGNAKIKIFIYILNNLDLNDSIIHFNQRTVCETLNVSENTFFGTLQVLKKKHIILKNSRDTYRVNSEYISQLTSKDRQSVLRQNYFAS